MIDQIANLNLTYLGELLNDKKYAIEQYETLNEYLVEHGCMFKDEPMPLLPKPSFISPKQSKTIQYVVEKISRVLNKFIGLYLQDEQVRQIMDFSEKENELFFIEPWYKIPLVITRLDAFMNDYSIKFLEFNCDSPAGIGFSEIVENGFSETLQRYPFFHTWHLEYLERIQALFKALLYCYNEFRSHHAAFPKKPVIAIVDWDDVVTAAEFVILKTFFENQGYDTVITSPQKCKINGDHMVADGQRIDLIYKRVITRELIAKWDEVQEFVQGIKDGLVCVCNPFRSYIAGNKKILALLSDPRFQHIYDHEELEVINRTIPWTAILANRKVPYQGFMVNQRNFISDNREKLVLKPASSYGGKDVFLGNETDQETWEQIIDEHIESETWVVQQYVTIPQEIFPIVQDGRLELQLKKVNLNPFALLGKYSGAISRVSDSSIINISAGGGLVPTMNVRKKAEIPKL